MSTVLRKIGKKVLLIPTVRRYVEEICQFYARSRVDQGVNATEGRLPFLQEICQLYAKSRVQQGLDAFAGEFAFHETLKTELLDIGKEFSEGDAKALARVVQTVLKERVKIVEVGSWKGLSTSVLAKTVADSHGSVFAVDHWIGSEGVPHHEIAKTVDIFSIFKRNMLALDVWDMVYPLVMDSQTAAQIFANGMLDLVFIDADHRYEHVKMDILSWLPKVRDGGILCGHDCEGYYSEYPQEIKKMIDEHQEEDTVSNVYHPGVIKALYDCFQDKYSIMPDSTIWYYLKNK